MKITVEAIVHAPMDEVWRAWSTPEDIRQWNTASPDWHTTRAVVDLRVEGAFSYRMEAKDGSMGFDFAGIYTTIVPNELIEATFGERDLRVEFAVVAGEVSIKQTFDAESVYPLEQQRAGWQAILNNFARYVEGKN